MNETQWLPGIVVLLLGAAGAIAYLLFSRQRASSHAGSDPLTDLDTRAQRLLDQIKELQADRHHLDDQQFKAEQQRLEREAADALRLRDEQARRRAAPAAKESTSAPRSQSWLNAHPQLKGALWGGGVVLFFALLGLFLSQEQKPRTEGREMTGKTPASTPTAPDEGDAQFKALMARLKSEPDNVELMGEVGHELLNQQQWDEAGKLTDRALTVDPFSVENRIHRGFLKAVRGDMDGSARDLQHLVDYYPDAQEGLLFLGLISMQRGNLKGALEKFEQFSAEVPADQQPSHLKQAISSLRRQLAASAN